MPSLKDFKVTFDDNQTVFSPGGILKGTVEVSLIESMEIKEIRVRLHGKAHVGWHEQHGKTHVYHYNNQDLCEMILVVHGEGKSSSLNTTLSQGTHTFPFNLTLPAPLPSSYEDKIGYIRYSIKATIVLPWKFDHNTKRMITILDTLDLNKDQNMLAPSSGKQKKYLCCWCCKSGPIVGEITTDRTGYVPGEWVVANAKVKNKSGSKVRKTSIEVTKFVTYRAKMKTKTERYCVQQISGPSCDAGKSVTLDNMKIQIPPLPPTENTHCKIIDINYTVMRKCAFDFKMITTSDTFGRLVSLLYCLTQIHGHLRTCAIDLRGMAKIIIGSVPIKSLPMYARNEQQDSLPPEEPLPAAYPSLPESSATVIENPAAGAPYYVPPPSYKVATDESFDVSDDKHTGGDKTYTPKYTFYDWNQSAFTYK